MCKIDSNQGKFGGVNIDASEIKSKKVLIDREGKKRYIIEFKNGVKVAYQQAKTNNASLYSLFSGENYVVAENVPSLELVGSTKKDMITVRGGSVIGINVANDKVKDEVSIKNSKGALETAILNSNKVGFGDIKASKQDNVSLTNTRYIHKR